MAIRPSVRGATRTTAGLRMRALSNAQRSRGKSTKSGFANAAEAESGPQARGRARRVSAEPVHLIRSGRDGHSLAALALRSTYCARPFRSCSWFRNRPRLPVPEGQFPRYGWANSLLFRNRELSRNPWKSLCELAGNSAKTAPKTTISLLTPISSAREVARRPDPGGRKPSDRRPGEVPCGEMPPHGGRDDAPAACLSH